MQMAYQVTQAQTKAQAAVQALQEQTQQQLAGEHICLQMIPADHTSIQTKVPEVLFASDTPVNSCSNVHSMFATQLWHRASMFGRFNRQQQVCAEKTANGAHETASNTTCRSHPACQCCTCTVPPLFLPKWPLCLQPV